jgi:hypothetical protein
MDAATIVLAMRITVPIAMARVTLGDRVWNSR